jgi:hypothetical protein
MTICNFLKMRQLLFSLFVSWGNVCTPPPELVGKYSQYRYVKKVLPSELPA